MENNKALELILAELQKINTKVDGLENRFDNLENRFDKLEQNVKKLEREVGNLDSEVKNFRKETNDNFEVVNMQIFVTQKFVLSNKDRINSIEVATLENLKDKKI